VSRTGDVTAVVATGMFSSALVALVMIVVGGRLRPMAIGICRVGSGGGGGGKVDV
jgi:hypothetical protein